MAPLATRKVKGYGWHPDLPDHRDRSALALGGVRKGVLPKTVRMDKRVSQPPIYDQGPLGSCTGNGTAGTVEYTLRELKLAAFTPSRLAIYHGARVIEGSAGYDSGAYIRDAIKVVNKQGAGDERLWPYDIAKFRQAPPAAYLDNAAKHLVTEYGRVPQTADAIQRILASGDPIVFGFSVYDYFESADMERTGILKLPAPTETMIGGHCVVLMGYLKYRGVWYFIARNSWSASWGRAGFFLIPFDYVLNNDLADDFWRITIVQGERAAKVASKTTRGGVRVQKVSARRRAA